MVLEGGPEPDGSDAPTVIDVIASPGYFESLRIAILRGRALTPSDDERSLPVAVVSEAFAERFGLGDEILGTRFKMSGPGSDTPWITVVGVSADVRYNEASLDRPEMTLPLVVLPMAQHPRRSMTLLLRGPTSPSLVGLVREVVRDIDPDQAIGGVSTMEERLEQQRVANKTGMYIFGALSLVALLLSAVGIFGVISFIVNRGRRELAIRLALGAEPADLLRQILTRSLKLTALGLAIGLLIAAGLTRLLEAQLPGLSTTHPLQALYHLGAGVLLCLVALLASLVPARRAMRLDPLVALRHD